MRTTLRFSDFDVIEYVPESEDAAARLRCWRKGVVELVAEVDRQSASATRHFGALLLGAAENVDPTGLEVVVPEVRPA